MRSYTDYPLQKHHTFGTSATARYYFEFTETEDMKGFLATNREWKNHEILILGEGSNLLFINDFQGLIINPNIPGISIAYEDRNNIWLEVGAGVKWDDLVEYAVFNGWGGIENLSLIPGKVGAAAVQNIGAYGMEIQTQIESVSGIDLETQTEITFEESECEYSYRDSIFKNKLKNRFIITSVSIKLDKFPEFILNYGDLKTETEKHGAINLRNIRKAVIAIRESKLPDPKVYGNAGSFFKNPVVETPVADQLLATYPKMPQYPGSVNTRKLAAGWLIEQCGWKGFRRGDAGVHEKQALVLVNYGKASGKEIFDLSEEIRQSVQERFGVELEREVNVIGSLP
ncbi:MAG TPA: UDP-N-acetylenolpyruvoylglucosamine reductase [Prolixibacteraceae bacterium]|nr:UDP-N-acetylenolpyruvoylglucosamine reductase [Prolixibacteraceae bacterium]